MSPTTDSQKEIVEQLLPVLMAKSYVQGIVWNQLGDADLPEFPHGGLLDGQLQPKPALDVLAELRKQHLM